jgi:hypothetical protein
VNYGLHLVLGTGVDKYGGIKAASSQSLVYGHTLQRKNYKMGRV